MRSRRQTRPSRPILFGKAVASVHLPGNGRALVAQRLLRGATQKAFAPAFTLNGLVLFQLLALHERGELAASERVSLDGSGRAVEVTAAQLASEAVLWWQRGAAFHDPEAMRLLGMAEARGFNGKRNLPAAIAYWRDAAARGDALARFELAQLYYEGIGVEAGQRKGLRAVPAGGRSGHLARRYGAWRGSAWQGHHWGCRRRERSASSAHERGQEQQGASRARLLPLGARRPSFGCGAACNARSHARRMITIDLQPAAAIRMR